MGGPSNITGSSSMRQFEIATNPVANTGEIADKLDKHMGIQDLANVQGAFDMETNRLLEKRDELLARMDNQSLEVSKKVRKARTNQARRTGRSSTILG